MVISKTYRGYFLRILEPSFALYGALYKYPSENHFLPYKIYLRIWDFIWDFVNNTQHTYLLTNRFLHIFEYTTSVCPLSVE